MSRPAVAHIRLDAFRHNYRIAKQCHDGKALAVIKANAYGHGAVPCANAIADIADGFAVAAIEEALQLREAGITAPILLLEGFFAVSELPLIVAHGLWIVIHHVWQVECLLAAKLEQPVQVWLKLDSGMHRVGFSPAEYASAYARLSQHVNVEKIVLMSHFADADNLNSQYTQQQIAVFKQTIVDLKGDVTTNNPIDLLETSLANSAAILGWHQARGDWSRPGIMLYGANPLPELGDNSNNILQPVMQLTSRIISIQKVTQGQSIGYGGIFTAEHDTTLGIVACGYADGYPRAATTGTPMVVDGKITRLIGRVSMDMLFVDLTDFNHTNGLSDVGIGSLVELWGDQVPVNTVAVAAGTVAYELFCNVKRVQFHYSDTKL